MVSKLIIIVDDDSSIRKAFSRLISLTKYTSMSFRDTKRCIYYLEQLNGTDLPFGYFVDMHIPEDQDGPEQLHNFLNERGMLRNFYFMTGDLSSSNQQLRDRTGIDVLMKDNSYELFDVINGMCSME
ncbi:MAG: hypothetical protein AABW46_02375 [Nanoarchaeota archaeon]